MLNRLPVSQFRRFSTSPARRSAFTLVELLVVIGIIVILMAILLPAVGRVRIAGQTTRTSATMSSISGAIERYYNDERTYPGLFSNQQLAGAVPITPALTIDGAGATLTSSENLVASLLGGIEPTFDSANNLTALAAKSDATTTIGKGPMNFSSSPIYRVRKGAYIDAAPGTLLPNLPYTTSGIAANAEQIGTAPTTKDSKFPEFLDNYGTPRPILYIRANTGQTGIASPIATKNPTGAALVQYTCYEFTYYTRGAVTGSGTAAEPDFAGDFNFPSAATVTSVDFYSNLTEYMANPANKTIPRGKDKFILISAGADRTFGTKDDLFIGGN